MSSTFFPNKSLFLTLLLLVFSSEEPSKEASVASANGHTKDAVEVTDSSQPSVSSEPRVSSNGVKSGGAGDQKSSKRKGVNSDEVRVMQKVLVNEVSAALLHQVTLLLTSFSSLNP